MTPTMLNVGHLIRGLQDFMKNDTIDEECIIYGADIVEPNDRYVRDLGCAPGAVVFDVLRSDGKDITLWINPERTSELLN